MTKVTSKHLDSEINQAEDFAERTKLRIKEGFEAKPLRRMKKPRVKPELHMVIGDSHAHPDEPNNRYLWAGRLAADRRPDVVVDIGDSADLPSLFGYDQGAKGPLFEGRAYWRDVDAYIDAKTQFNLGLEGFSPRLVKCDGNHEDRIRRLLESDPRFAGVIGPHNLMDKELGWERHEFLEIVEISGVGYSHYYKARASQRPVSGVVQTRSVIQSRPGSFCRVFGHTHVYQYYETSDGSSSGRKISSINCGCYFGRDSAGHNWAGDDVNHWRAGILMLRVFDGQVIGHEWISLEEIHDKYG
ncbi:MAG: hypothetical protein CME70_18290 [Halobacteriovorax sp.]|nr:hypothetical protein [Halobacteriovorax sp.]